MRTGTIAFLIGCWLVQQQHTLWTWSALVCIALLFLLAYQCDIGRRLVWRPLLVVALGMCWASWQAGQQLDRRLPAALEGVDLQLVGRIDGLPSVEAGRIRFELSVQQVHAAPVPWSLPARVRLSWYRTGERPQPGETWQLSVRLKRPSGFSNPGGFDYEAWLYQQDIQATGSVRKGDNRRLAPTPAWAWLDRWRAGLQAQLRTVLPDTQARAILMALVIGVRDDINTRSWDSFIRTGTGHLIAISGLHISLVAGWVFLITRSVWARIPVACRRFPAIHAAAAAAVAAAVTYAALAGFSIPTQRALIMIGVVMGAVGWRRALAPMQALSVALLLVLLHDSRAVLSVGFWLSFFAVTVIVYALHGRLDTRAGWWRQTRLPVWMAIAMLPVSVWFFQRASLISPLANLLAVPWVGLLVVPLALAGSVLLLLPMLAVPLLMLAHAALETFRPLLIGLSAVPFAQWQAPTPAWPVLLLAILACAVLLAPRGMPARWVGLLLLLPLVLQAPKPLARGHFDFTLLDVGQGLAAVLRTRRHVLVYDTGPRFGEDFDTGRAVLAPFLRAQGLRQVDLLVVSHGDIDHRGGVDGLAGEVPVMNVLSSVPAQLTSMRAQGCRAGQAWDWDGVRFAMLGPSARLASTADNDHSCVLKITGLAGSVLLTGDIEARAERALLADASALRASVLVAPHHGSQSSSSMAFIEAVAPQTVLFAVGYRNRYGFPRPEVVARYRQQGAAPYATDSSGAMTFQFRAEAPPTLAAQQRRETRRYWSRD